MTGDDALKEYRDARDLRRAVEERVLRRLSDLSGAGSARLGPLARLSDDLAQLLALCRAERELIKAEARRYAKALRPFASRGCGPNPTAAEREAARAVGLADPGTLPDPDVLEGRDESAVV